MPPLLSRVQGNAYSRLQQEDVTVGQALTLASAPTAPTQVSAWSQQVGLGWEDVCMCVCACVGAEG